MFYRLRLQLDFERVRGIILGSFNSKIDNMVENTGEGRAERPYVENGTYFIYYGEGAKQVAEGVFGPSLREGVCYTSEKLSRKQIVPRITEVLTGN